MNACMVIAAPKPGHLDDLVGFWDDETVAEITSQQGNCGFVLCRDLANRRVVALSLWDGDADADAAGLTFTTHMASGFGLLASPPQVERLEVAVDSGGVPGNRSI